ncbi:TOBE domain-containing protein [Halosegnis marinus]|uniref:TOBE domain-containing protein n=1 Tax=Halosegnis marinus TaxID=3034023 RepID=A0ABD5ZPE0_9EURY|nr:TOBE domain-containing protein [Halosegnis sp. DT85]
MDAEFDARLHEGDVSFDARDAALLRAVDEAGSLNAAAGELGRSYARAHERLTALEAAFGPLVERTRGGAGGGGSELTDGARDLLARFDRLRAGFDAVAAVEETVLDGRVTERDGELAAVETAAGTVRALVPPGADRVALTLRADAVTLHAPAEVPDADATSARNRLAGTVTALDRGAAVVRVAVDVGADDPLAALVTTDSADRLGLEAGASVVASFKATATRGVET